MLTGCPSASAWLGGRATPLQRGRLACSRSGPHPAWNKAELAGRPSPGGQALRQHELDCPVTGRMLTHQSSLCGWKLRLRLEPGPAGQHTGLADVWAAGCPPGPNTPAGTSPGKAALGHSGPTGPRVWAPARTVLAPPPQPADARPGRDSQPLSGPGMKREPTLLCFCCLPDCPHLSRGRWASWGPALGSSHTVHVGQECRRGGHFLGCTRESDDLQTACTHHCSGDAWVDSRITATCPLRNTRHHVHVRSALSRMHWALQ